MNNVLPIVAAGVGIYFLTQPSQKKAGLPPPITTGNTTPYLPGGGGPTPAGNGSGLGPPITGVHGTVDRFSTPNVETWKMPEWHMYFRDLYDNSDIATASATIWSAWNNPLNIFKDKFPTESSFVFAVATYKPNEAVNAPGIIPSSATPVYNTWYNYMYHYDDVWRCQDWINWYESVKSDEGAAVAESRFMDAWEHPDNWSFGVWNEHGAGYTCGDRCDFVEYFAARGMQIGNFGVTTYCNLSNVPANLSQGAEDLSGGVKDTANVLAALVPLAAGAMVFIYLNRERKKE